MVSHSLMVSIPLLRLPEVAFGHGRNPFPGLTLPQVLLTQRKTQEDTHHPYQDVTSPDRHCRITSFSQPVSLMTQPPLTAVIRDYFTFPPSQSPRRNLCNPPNFRSALPTLWLLSRPCCSFSSPLPAHAAANYRGRQEQRRTAQHLR